MNTFLILIPWAIVAVVAVVLFFAWLTARNPEALDRGPKQSTPSPPSTPTAIYTGETCVECGSLLKWTDHGNRCSKCVGKEWRQSNP